MKGLINIELPTHYHRLEWQAHKAFVYLEVLFCFCGRNTSFVRGQVRTTYTETVHGHIYFSTLSVALHDCAIGMSPSGTEPILAELDVFVPEGKDSATNLSFSLQAQHIRLADLSSLPPSLSLPLKFQYHLNTREARADGLANVHNCA